MNRTVAEGDRLEVVSLSNDVCVALAGRVLLAHFRGPTPASSVTSLRQAMANARGRGPVVFFGVIETTSVPPDDEARLAFARFFEDEAAQLACIVVAIRGEGFRAAMVRAIAAAVLTVLPKFRIPVPRHIVPTPEEAAQQARRHLEGLDAEALLRAFGTLAARRPA